jgi:hypothetical protein
VKRGQPLQRKTPMRPRSAKMARLYRQERVPLVVEMLLADGLQRCEFPRGCHRVATTLHELLGRAQGGSITDRDNIRRSCIPHNTWAEDNPAEAESIGWKIQRRHAA